MNNNLEEVLNGFGPKYLSITTKRKIQSKHHCHHQATKIGLPRGKQDGLILWNIILMEIEDREYLGSVPLSAALGCLQSPAANTFWVFQGCSAGPTGNEGDGWKSLSEEDALASAVWNHSRTSPTFLLED